MHNEEWFFSYLPPCTFFIVHYPLFIIHSKNMFKQFISAIPGADVYMIGSFLTFFVFFLLVSLYLVFADKRHLRQMSQLPLDESTDV
ncbi:hypothetical protein GCM10028807_04260 [Spirosoma daeguense]